MVVVATPTSCTPDVSCGADTYVGSSCYDRCGNRVDGRKPVNSPFLLPQLQLMPMVLLVVVLMILVVNVPMAIMVPVAIKLVARLRQLSLLLVTVMLCMPPSVLAVNITNALVVVGLNG